MTGRDVRRLETNEKERGERTNVYAKECLKGSREWDEVITNVLQY